MTHAEWIQIGSLIVAVLTLFYLIQYVGYTKTIAKEAGNQSEATFKPAVVVTQTGIITNPPRLRNIGNGAALDVEWTITGTKKRQIISYLEAGQDSEALPFDLQKLEHAAVESGTNKVSIRCSYRSIAGRTYISVSTYDFEKNRFSAAFDED
jgi:hypothetical protein